MTTADTIAEAQAKRDEENAPPPGVSRKAWGAIKNGWVPNPGTPMYDVYLRYCRGVDPDAPPTRWETIKMGLWLCMMIGMATGLAHCMTSMPQPKHTMPQHCLPGVERKYQQSCTQWTAGGNAPVDIGTDKSISGNNYNPGEFGG